MWFSKFIITAMHTWKITYYLWSFYVHTYAMLLHCQSSLNVEKSLNSFCIAIILGSPSKNSMQSSILSLLSKWSRDATRKFKGHVLSISRFWIQLLFIIMVCLVIVFVCVIKVCLEIMSRLYSSSNVSHSLFKLAIKLELLCCITRWVINAWRIWCAIRLSKIYIYSIKQSI